MSEKQLDLPGMEGLYPDEDYSTAPPIGTPWPLVQPWLDTLYVLAHKSTPEYLYEHLELGGGEISLKFIRHMLWCLKVFDRKQQNYGPANIAQLGCPGIMSRVKDDKFSRLETLEKNPDAALDGEPILDAWHDTSVYGILGAMVHVGDWPTLEELGVQRIDLEADIAQMVEEHGHGRMTASDCMFFLEERLRMLRG